MADNLRALPSPDPVRGEGMSQRLDTGVNNARLCEVLLDDALDGTRSHSPSELGHEEPIILNVDGGTVRYTLIGVHAFQLRVMVRCLRPVPRIVAAPMLPGTLITGLKRLS